MPPLAGLGFGVFRYSPIWFHKDLLYEYSLRVQVPNSHTLTQNLYYNYYYPKPKNRIIGYLDLLGVFKRAPKAPQVGDSQNRTRRPAEASLTLRVQGPKE